MSENQVEYIPTPPVAVEETRAVYFCDGSSTHFEVPFPVDAGASSLRAYLADRDGLYPVVELQRNAHWGFSSGVLITSSAFDSGYKLAVVRDTPAERLGNYTPGGPLTAASLNADLTRLTYAIQDLKGALSLTLSVPPTVDEHGVVDVWNTLREYTVFASGYWQDALSAAQLASGCADNASTWAGSASAWGSQAGSLAGSATASAMITFGGYTVSGAVTFASGLTVSGGMLINGDSAATEPWVHSRFIRSSGGWVAYGEPYTSDGEPVVPPVISLGQDFDVKTFQNGNVDYAQLHLDQGNNPYGEPWYPFVNLGVFSSGGTRGYVCLSGTLHDPSSAGGHHIDLVAQGEHGAYSIVQACPGEANIYVENAGAETPWATVLVNTGEVSLEQGFSGADSSWEGLLRISRGKVFISGNYYDVGGSEFHCSGRPVLDTENPLFRNTPFITTFGGYTFDFANNRIFMSGSGAAINIESGGIVASGASGASVVLSGGTAKLMNEYDGIHQFIAVHSAGIDISASDPDRNINLNCHPGSVFVNSRPVLTELVASTDSEATSVTIPVLSGGTAYTFTQPLTSLSVASMESSMRESWLRFTVASGGSVSINDSGFEWFGGRPSAYEGGSSYSIGVWNGMMVCGELED